MREERSEEEKRGGGGGGGMGRLTGCEQTEWTADSVMIHVSEDARLQRLWAPAANELLTAPQKKRRSQRRTDPDRKRVIT